MSLASAVSPELVTAAVGALACGVLVVLPLVTLIVLVILRRRQRFREADPRWTLSELPRFPSPGAS